MADSFYGGRPGFSFIIVANYESEEAMIKAFQAGPDYEAVHFDEHVIINTENKNNDENGRIYRRGYDYTNDMGGAIYVGTIVGPAGPAPMLELTTVEEVESLANEAGVTSEDGVVSDNGYTYLYNTGEYAPTTNLVPGVTEDSEFNDEITWASFSVRDENGENTTAYIGFVIPYLVADFTAESVDPYYNRSAEDTADFVNENLITREDDGSHPFYEKWHISVPKGIKGESLSNFRVETASSSIQEYDGQEDDIDNSRQVLVYDYYNYDADESGNPVSIYLGDYNMIDNIAIDDQGTVTIEYSHDDTVTYTQLFKWIESITLDTVTGLFKVTYNTDSNDDGVSDVYTAQLKWVSGIDVDLSGNITVTYIDGSTETLDTVINFIQEMAITDDYHLIVYYTSEVVRQANTDAGLNITYRGSSEWYDLGSVKDDSGILIGLNVDLTTGEEAGYDLTDISQAIEYLNETYDGGLVAEDGNGSDVKGKVVTIGDGSDSKLFYAYDYQNNTWYYLGNLNSDPSGMLLVSTEDSSGNPTVSSSLAVGGFWFLVED